MAPGFLALRLGALATSGALLLFGCGASESASMGFGTGGTDCELTGVTSTFSTGGTVHMVVTVSPLPTSVTVSATKDGDSYYEPTVVAFDGTVPCMHADMADLEAGHYEFLVAIPGSQMPPLTGDFDVKS